MDAMNAKTMSAVLLIAMLLRVRVEEWMRKGAIAISISMDARWVPGLCAF